MSDESNVGIDQQPSDGGQYYCRRCRIFTTIEHIRADLQLEAPKKRRLTGNLSASLVGESISPGSYIKRPRLFE